MTVQMVNGKSDKLNQDYLVLSKIGEGSFGEAFKAFSNIDGKEYALSGWNDDAWYDCWECIGDDFTEASDENYTIKPIYNERHEIIDYEIV